MQKVIDQEMKLIQEYYTIICILLAGDFDAD